MNRSQKISAVKISYVVIFLLSIIVTVGLQFPIDKLAVILYPLITVLVLIWRSIRDDYDLFILHKLVFDVNDDIGNVEFVGKYPLRIGFFKFAFNKFKIKASGILKIHFDIANKGNSEITLHDYQVRVIHPKERLVINIPLFETYRVYNPMEDKIVEETNYLRRRHLDKGGLHTCIFPFEPKYDYKIIRIDVNTYKTEASNEYLFYFAGDHFFYALCKYKSLFHRDEAFYFKHQAKIEAFLKKC